MRTVLVTGGNRGIGLAIVKGMAENQEDKILLGCRDVSKGEKLARDIGENVEAVQLNLDDRGKLFEDISEIQKSHPQIDVLINNAGILTEGNAFDVSIEQIQESLQVNAISAYELTKAVLPTMKKNKYGRIVNLSSGWGAMSDGLTGPFCYSLSKALLNAFTITLAQQLPKNVKMNSMCPGWVRTDMGGMAATRSPEEGAETAIWLANLPDDGHNGCFFRDKEVIDW